MLLSFLLISSLAGIFTACDDIEDEYITDTQLSILQESRTSLNYLLKNSTYGTAPGTYPETGKDILNAAIAELDALITRVEAGEELDETTLEAAVAKVNQAIDEFKNSKYYNLSPEAQQYINNLLAKADEILAIVNDETKWGNHQRQHPVENKSVLESAAKDLESLAERIKSGSITDMTQEIYDEAIAAADKKVEEVEDSAWPDNSQITWNLFVDGNAGSYIDFGYSEDYVKFGEDDNQAVDFDGNLLMKSEDSLAMSPNGNGGWFKSLINAGLDKDLKDKGVEWLNVFGVDNVLQQIADPVFVGAIIESGCVSGSKVVRKCDPYERVGAMCLENGKPSIVEYYELTPEMAEAKNENGSLQYGFGVILNYLFRVDKLMAIAEKSLPLHVVEKKVPYIDENGTEHKPETPNAYKFETLILDMVYMMDNSLPFEVDREKEFAPVKNATGTDSVETARALLEKNGIEI